VLSSLLEDDFPCDAVTSGSQAIEYCQASHPDLILLDINMPGMNGLEVCHELKSNVFTSDIPVIFITATADDEIQNQCWEAGGSDFIQKPFNAQTLINRVRFHLKNALRITLLERLTYNDQLTELHNRHYLVEEIPAFTRTCIRENQPISAIMLDIDNFKSFNDTYGHGRGDICLEMVSKAIKKSCFRGQDIAIRMGGEEFLILLFDADKNAALKVVKRIFENIDELAIPHINSSFSQVTLSAGIASIPLPKTKDLELTELISDADKNLYKAKRNGRNQYCM
jgi:diguanylate cyclase (GGDEF)-like protein